MKQKRNKKRKEKVYVRVPLVLLVANLVREDGLDDLAHDERTAHDNLKCQDKAQTLNQRAKEWRCWYQSGARLSLIFLYCRVAQFTAFGSLKSWRVAFMFIHLFMLHS